jgi:hypothetical protein
MFCLVHFVHLRHKIRTLALKNKLVRLQHVDIYIAADTLEEAVDKISGDFATLAVWLCKIN